MSCKYYTELTLGWMLNNKIIVLLGLLSFCLFVSTLAIAGQRNRLAAEVEELKTLTSTAAPTEIPTTDSTTEEPSSVSDNEVGSSTITVTPEGDGSSSGGESEADENDNALTSDPTTEVSSISDVDSVQSVLEVRSSNGNELEPNENNDALEKNQETKTDFELTNSGELQMSPDGTSEVSESKTGSKLLKALLSATQVANIVIR